MDDYNKIDLQELYFQLYLENASDKEIIEINYLLEQNEYDLVLKRVDQCVKNILYKKDIKNTDSGGWSDEVKIIMPELEEKEFSTENMDPQTFELYCILVLIDKYQKEKDENKKRMLQMEIDNALNKYRSYEKKEQRGR